MNFTILAFSSTLNKKRSKDSIVLTQTFLQISNSEKMFLLGFRGLLGSTRLQRATEDDTQYKLLVKNDFYKNKICTNYLPWRYMFFFQT